VRSDERAQLIEDIDGSANIREGIVEQTRLSKEIDIAAGCSELKKLDESINKTRNQRSSAPLDEAHQQRRHRLAQPCSEVHMTDGQGPADTPMEPEKGIPSKDKPDMSRQPDLKNPEKPEEEIPDEPTPDMDPPGQDEPDETA
jgi:hypothetical protein